jgi:hypothetical protein
MSWLTAYALFFYYRFLLQWNNCILVSQQDLLVVDICALKLIDVVVFVTLVVVVVVVVIIIITIIIIIVLVISTTINT